MSLALYMDVHMRRAVIEALRERRVDVLTAQADGTTELLDPALLDRAAELRRVLFSQDEDLLAEAARRQRDDIPFAGVVYAHQFNVSGLNHARRLPPLDYRHASRVIIHSQRADQSGPRNAAKALNLRGRLPSLEHHAPPRAERPPLPEIKTLVLEAIRIAPPPPPPPNTLRPAPPDPPMSGESNVLP